MLTFDDARETYGEMRLRMWKAGDYSELTKTECLELREMDEWERSNPEEVEALNACLGRVARLKNNRTTFMGEMLEAQYGSSYKLPAGKEFVLRTRVRDRFLGQAVTEENQVYLLRRDWLEVYPEGRRPMFPPFRRR